MHLRVGSFSTVRSRSNTVVLRCLHPWASSWLSNFIHSSVATSMYLLTSLSSRHHCKTFGQLSWLRFSFLRPTRFIPLTSHFNQKQRVTPCSRMSCGRYVQTAC